MKKFFIFLILLALVLFFSGCSEETGEPVASEDEINSGVSEEPSKPEIVPEEPEELSEESIEPEEKIDPKTFMTFEEITALGCYPVWMKPNTVIVYDENGNPEIIEGGVLTEEDCAKDEMYSEIGFIELNDKTYRIKPNTKVEYYKDGFIQNIYFLWPDGSYNLSPLSKTENAKITYYKNIDEYENKSGETVFLNENQCHSVFWISDGMNLFPESTTKPMDFPRYEITFTYVGTEHCIYVDSNNVFTSTMLEGGNYVSVFEEDHFSKTEALFNEAK
ncbi:MAG: hypothetical protein IKD39_02195 [Oscillospiraceae bacterium]|nr:hypothetical protein [Oscillospiraceae bacterium]MBR3963103.1 hypothetical protein [Oscillospiraceae bacterium]